MIVKAKITGMVISKNCLSIKLSTTYTEQQFYVESLRELKGVNQRYVFEYSSNGKNKKIHVNGKIQSINIRKGLFFIIHAKADKYIITDMVDAIDAPVVCKFLNRKEMLLSELLRNVAKIMEMPEEEVLYQFTTYTKNGRHCEGKRSIFELSDRHKDVIIDKLRKVITSSGLKAPSE